MGSVTPVGQDVPITVEPRGPCLIVTFRSGATDQQYAAYLRDFTAKMWDAIERYGRVVPIHDTTRWQRSTARQRQMHADWIRENHAVIRDHSAGIAFVIDSPLVRGGLTAVLWLARLPAPYKVVSTMDEALEWAHGQLRRCGVEP